jgi:hypothetical protein
MAAKPKLNLKSVVRELLEKHTTHAAATGALADLLAADEDLRRLVAVVVMRQFSDTKIVRKKETHSRRRPGPHRSPLPSKAQKAGALRAEKNFTEMIFDRKLRGGRKLGEIRVHELRAIAESSAETATSFLQRGFDDAVETFWCIGLSHHCVSSDPFAKVSDVIKPSVASSIFEKARISAAQSLRDSSGRLARELISQAQQQGISAS